jgi:hypothetical protein
MACKALPLKAGIPKPRPEPPMLSPDYAVWESEYKQWQDGTCPCGTGYYCKAHGKFVDGDQIRAGRPGRDKQTPETCHPDINATNPLED